MIWRRSENKKIRRGNSRFGEDGDKEVDEEDVYKHEIHKEKTHDQIVVELSDRVVLDCF